jgi:dimeric dUTPase (all-alpha-NTP-PPase superfamily)
MLSHFDNVRSIQQYPQVIDRLIRIGGKHEINTSEINGSYAREDN